MATLCKVHLVSIAWGLFAWKNHNAPVHVGSNLHEHILRLKRPGGCHPQLGEAPACADDSMDPETGGWATHATVWALFKLMEYRHHALLPPCRSQQIEWSSHSAQYIYSNCSSTAAHTFTIPASMQRFVMGDRICHPWPLLRRHRQHKTHTAQHTTLCAKTAPHRSGWPSWGWFSSWSYAPEGRSTMPSPAHRAVSADSCEALMVALIAVSMCVKGILWASSNLTTASILWSAYGNRI